MPADESLAFARLFARRREELNLSVVDIADRSRQPLEIVIGWEQGSAIPTSTELVDISDVLKLPFSLLEEALRRVHEHRASQTTPDPHPMVNDETLYDVDLIQLDEEPDADYPTPQGEPPRPGPVMGAWSRFTSTLSTRFRQEPPRSALPVTNPSYLENPEELVTYRLRLIMSVTGIAILALMLRWALGGLIAAISDLWMALAGTL